MKNVSKLVPGSPGTTTAPVSADGVEWLRVKDVKSRFGFSQRTAERLIQHNRVVSTTLRAAGQKRGIRLISAASLRALLQAGTTPTETATAIA